MEMAKTKESLDGLASSLGLIFWIPKEERQKQQLREDLQRFFSDTEEVEKHYQILIEDTSPEARERVMAVLLER
jgi:hypothetical protein